MRCTVDTARHRTRPFRRPARTIYRPMDQHPWDLATAWSDLACSIHWVLKQTELTRVERLSTIRECIRKELFHTLSIASEALYITSVRCHR